MNWPDDAICKRICALWALAYGSTNVGESTNALTALKRLQAELGLNDVELNFVAEYQQKEPTKSIDSDKTPERPINVLELILHLFEVNHIILTLEQMVTVALITLHTHVFDEFLHTLRLILRSAEPGCGKTTLLSCMERLVNNGFMTSNTSAAALYYQLRKSPRTTLLIDEVEHSSLWTLDPLLLSILDAGHRHGGCVTRVLRGEVVRFPVFAPLVLSAVPKKRFAPQLLSRAIAIDMQKYPEGRDELLPNDPHFAVAHGFVSEWATTFKRPQICKIPFPWPPRRQLATID